MTNARSLAVRLRWAVASAIFLIASLVTNTANAANVIERIDALTLGTEQDLVRSAVIDTANGFAYFGTFTDPGRIVKVDLGTFQAVDEIVLEPNENKLRSAVIDTANGYAYFGTSTQPGRVVKIDLNTFTRVGAITLNAGEDYLESAAIDPTDGLGGVLYFSTYTSPIEVVKIDLNTFTRLGAVTLDTGENLSGAMLVDPGSGYAYVGTSDNVIVRVDLSPFARVDALTLPVNEFGQNSGFIDAANGYAYFGTAGVGRVVKVDLSTFTRVGSITTGDGPLYTANFDPGTGYAYFGTNTSPGRVVAIDLDSFTEVGSDVLDAGEDSIYSAVLDAGAGYAYFGTFTDPGQVVRVRVVAPFVLRFAGPNRYATAAVVSDRGFADPDAIDTVFVAVGNDFPDAVAGAAVAGKLGAPLLLVETDSIPGATAAELTRLTPDTIVVLGGTAVISQAVENALEGYASTVTRLAGANRYETAVAISQHGFPGSADTVIVATGLGYADALSGGPAAVALNGPVLLTDPDELPAAVSAEITRLSPSRIIVVGGTAAVSADVFTDLQALAGQVDRISGPDRYATAVAISLEAFPGGAYFAYVATGLNFPDALAGAVAAGFAGAPVLLVPGTSLPGAVSDEITRLGASVVVVLGGVAVVSPSVEMDLETLLGI